MQILGSLDWDSSDGHYHPSLIILALRRILLHSLVRILDCGWLPWQLELFWWGSPTKLTVILIYTSDQLILRMRIHNMRPVQWPLVSGCFIVCQFMASEWCGSDWGCRSSDVWCMRGQLSCVLGITCIDLRVSEYQSTMCPQCPTIWHTTTTMPWMIQTMQSCVVKNTSTLVQSYNDKKD